VTLRSIVALGVLAVSAAGAASPPPRFVDYLYLEANEGGSSGGHAAIRLDDVTYHFQHEPGGIIRLQRDDSEHFRYAYGVLENRTIHVSRVAVPEAAYADVRHRFGERYLIERRLFDERDALREDRDLIALLLAHRPGGGTATVALRGAGFFFPDDGASPPSPTARALLRRVRETYGPDAIARRIDEVKIELARLAPAAGDAPTPEVTGSYPHFAYPFSRHYSDLLGGLAALAALERALPVRAVARWESASAGLELDAAERHALRAFADRLEDQLVRLLRSERADWGYPFLVGMARLAVLDESERTGRLVLLDAFPPRSEVIRWSSLRENRDAARELLGDAREDLARVRGHLRSEAPLDERGYAEVEDAGNRVLELETALAEERDVRVSAGPLVPSREAAWPVAIVPDVTEDDLVRARAAETRFSARLERRYAYDLVSHNCVSEIFRTVGSAATGLGREIGGPWSFDFIPFLSVRSVNGAWNVVERTTLSSYRRARLDEMYRRENPLRAWLRECNTVTSTIYRRNADDSFFVLFTDDVVATRPLFGAVNVAAAVVAGLAGVALLPADHGHALVSGLRGAVFSLPELAFVNLRKGSFTYVARRDVPEAGDRLPR
jgi:hypothetical protein